MGNDFRIWTQNLYQSLTSATLNDLQDTMSFFSEVSSSTLAPTTPLEGLGGYYWQGVCPDTIGGGESTVIDSSIDWRNRVIRMIVVQQGALNQLPESGAYNPSSAVSISGHIWYTGTDFDADPAAGTGTYWEPIVNVRFGAVNNVGASGTTQGDLVAWNATAASVWIMTYFECTPDAS